MEKLSYEVRCLQGICEFSIFMRIFFAVTLKSYDCFLWAVSIGVVHSHWVWWKPWSWYWKTIRLEKNSQTGWSYWLFRHALSWILCCIHSFPNKYTLCVCVCVCVCAYIYTYINHKWPWGFPGGSAAKNRSANVLRFWTLSRNIPHSMEQLSLCTTTIKTVIESPGTATSELMSNNYWSPHALEPMLHNKRSHHNEKPCTTTNYRPTCHN